MVAQPRFTPARGMSPERVNRRIKKTYVPHHIYEKLVNGRVFSRGKISG